MHFFILRKVVLHPHSSLLSDQEKQKRSLKQYNQGEDYLEDNGSKEPKEQLAKIARIFTALDIRKNYELQITEKKQIEKRSGILNPLNAEAECCLKPSAFIR